MGSWGFGDLGSRWLGVAGRAVCVLCIMYYMLHVEIYMYVCRCMYFVVYCMYIIYVLYVCTSICCIMFYYY
jgi:hypothetical protein